MQYVKIQIHQIRKITGAKVVTGNKHIPKNAMRRTGKDSTLD